MTLDEIQTQWDTDSAIDQLHLGEDSAATPKLHAKYLKLLTSAQLRRIKLQSDLNVLKTVKFRYYRGEMGKEELAEQGWDQWQGVKPLKSEMDQFLVGDSDLNTLQMRIDYITVMIDAITSIMNQIKARDWQIKNAITWKQFLAGG